MASSALSLRDNMLLQAAADGLSGEEMEARYGIPAAEAVLRVREILKSRDIWSELEQEQLLLADLQKLKQKIMDRVDMFTGGRGVGIGGAEEPQRDREDARQARSRHGRRPPEGICHPR